MTVNKLEAAAVGLPVFDFTDAVDGETFSLSSHMRARQALEFGLAIADPGFNIFVVGEDQSGRMTATVEYLHQALESRPPPDDWVYLSNFRRPHRPKPYRLPAGMGRRLRDRVATLVTQLQEALGHAFGDAAYQSRVQTESGRLGTEASRRMEDLRAEMLVAGLDLARSPDGHMVVARATPEDGGEPPPLTPEQQRTLEEHAQRFSEHLGEISRWASDQQIKLVATVHDIDRQVADKAIEGLIDEIAREFATFPGLGRWFIELRADVLDNLGRFRPAVGDAMRPVEPSPDRYYNVNLLVDHGDDPHPTVVVEANPSYENLFGQIEYRQIEGGVATDFNAIRSGSLHRANGGVLVLRAEAIAANPMVWDFLKGALRDGEIRLEELHRSGSLPIAGAPRPQPIPLSLKVVIVGAPHWYYTFFSVDPNFQTYFKVKADIDGDMDATPANLACYADLIRQMARVHGEARLERDGIRRLLGIASRWTGDRRKLTAQFERIDSLVSEAFALGRQRNVAALDAAIVDTALANRRRRNARIEDRLHESIADGLVMIDTQGSVVGQVNALTVRDLGDHRFGTPARVTARASVGRLGITNIERETLLGGPIQQKGVMVLQGFLAGHFARRFPLSFNCSITFEQSYGGVEGDSASVAELLAILSDLSRAPLRQDLALTGSVNQRGHIQAVGGVLNKVEGFFRTCAEAGGFTGTQGVVLPAANRTNLILNEDVVAAVATGKFHLYAVDTIEDAIGLFTGIEAGVPDKDGHYPPDSIYGRVMRELEAFDRVLASRNDR